MERGGMPRRQVLYLSVNDPSIPINGAAVRGMHFVNRLGEQFDIDLIHLEGVGHAIPRDLKSRFAEAELNVRSRQLFSFTRPGYFLFDPRMYRAAARRLAAGRYDWIFCDYGLAALYGLLMRQRAGVPFVYSSHNVEYVLYRHKVSSNWLRLPLSYYVQVIERAAVKACAILVAISQEDARVYETLTDPDKILIIPQCFDSRIYNPDYDWRPAARPIVMFCGDFGAPPNLDGVRQAMDVVLRPVVRRCPDVLFRFVGASPPRDIAHPNVEFTGFVDDYVSQLKSADVIISPVRTGGGAPTKLIEALACGKHVVATPIGARTLERDYHGLHVCPIEGFADQIIRLLEHRPGVERRNYQRLRCQYDWSANLQRLATRMNGLRPAIDDTRMATAVG